MTVQQLKLIEPLGMKMGFPCGSAGQESACNAGDLGLIPGLGRSPGEGTAIHSSILPWRIPWTEEYGRLQSTESPRVRQDRTTFTFTFHSIWNEAF